MFDRSDWLCTTCGATGLPKRAVPGSFLIELSLWIFCIGLALMTHWALILLPLAYSVYRITGRKRACRTCGGTALVPLDSPVGRQMHEQLRRRPE